MQCVDAVGDNKYAKQIKTRTFDKTCAEGLDDFSRVGFTHRQERYGQLPTMFLEPDEFRRLRDLEPDNETDNNEYGAQQKGDPPPPGEKFAAR